MFSDLRGGESQRMTQGSRHKTAKSSPTDTFKEVIMITIYETANKLAYEQKAGIVRLDIQYIFKIQAHRGYLTLTNDKEYVISSTGRVTRLL